MHKYNHRIPLSLIFDSVTSKGFQSHPSVMKASSAMEYSHTNGNENYSFGHNAWPAENQQPVPASQGLGQSKEAMVLHPQHLHHMSQPGLPEHLENGHQELHGTHASGSTSHGQSPFAQHHSQQNSLIRLNAVFAESRSAQLPDLQDVYVSCSGPLGSDFPDMNAVLGTASGHDGTGMMTNHRSGSGVAMALNNGHHGDLVHPSCSLPSQGDANQTMQMREMQPQSHVVQIQSHAQCQQASAMQLNATMQQASPFGQPPDVVHLQASEDQHSQQHFAVHQQAEMIAAAQSVQVTDGTNGRRPSQTGGVTMGVIQQENMQQQQAQHAAHVVHNQMIAHAATQMASQQMLACSQPQMIQHHQQQQIQQAMQLQQLGLIPPMIGNPSGDAGPAHDAQAALQATAVAVHAIQSAHVQQIHEAALAQQNVAQVQQAAAQQAQAHAHAQQQAGHPEAATAIAAANAAMANAAQCAARAQAAHAQARHAQAQVQQDKARLVSVRALPSQAVSPHVALGTNMQRHSNGLSGTSGGHHPHHRHDSSQSASVNSMHHAMMSATPVSQPHQTHSLEMNTQFQHAQEQVSAQQEAQAHLLAQAQVQAIHAQQVMSGSMGIQQQMSLTGAGAAAPGLVQQQHVQAQMHVQPIAQQSQAQSQPVAQQPQSQAIAQQPLAQSQSQALAQAHVAQIQAVAQAQAIQERQNQHILAAANLQHQMAIAGAMAAAQYHVQEQQQQMISLLPPPALPPPMAAAMVAKHALPVPLPSKYRGVHWDSAAGAWNSIFAEGDVRKFLGHFNVEDEAALAWDQEALAYFGGRPFHLNNPEVSLKAYAEDTATSRPQSPPKTEPYRSSSYRGVSRGRGKKKWRAMIQHQKKQIHVGYFDTGLEAARAYDREAVSLLGADAVTNFPLSDYYPELTDLGKQGLPGQGIPIDAGDDENYTYEEYDDDNEDDNSAQPSTSHPMYSGLAHQGISWPQGSSKPQGSPPLPPTQHGIFSRPPAATSLSSGANPTGSEPLPGSSIAASGRPKSLDELLRDLGRSELWGVKRDGNSWRAQITLDLGTYASAAEAAAAHDRAALWTLGITANTNLEKNESLISLRSRAADEKMEGEVGIGTEPRETGPEPQTSEACEPARKRTKLSKYRGVETHDGGSTWHTVVKVQGTEKEIGTFRDEEDAARCYDRCSALLWGLQAHTNFPLVDALTFTEGAQALVQQLIPAYNEKRRSMVRTDPSRTAVARPLTPNPPADDGIMATDSLATQQDQQPSQQGVSDVKGPVSGNPLSPVGQASSSPMILPSIAPAVADSLGLPADGGTALQPSGASGEIEPQPDAHHVGDIPEGPPMDAAASS